MKSGLKAILSLVIVSGLLITGCSGEAGQAPVIGKPAPEFELKNLDGQSVSLSDLKGQPVLINFWATWCTPCQDEMPHLQQIHDEWSDKGLVVLAINIGESHSEIEEFMQSQGLSLPVLLDTGGSVTEKYNVLGIGIPTTFFLDKDGIIQEKIIGAFQNKAQIEKRLNQIIP